MKERFYCRMFCCEDHRARLKEFKRSEVLSAETERLNGMIYRQSQTIALLQAKLEEYEAIKTSRSGYLKRLDVPAPPVVTHTVSGFSRDD